MAMMDKMQAAMEATLVPVAAKINGQRHVAAVRDAFTLAFPMTLAGSLVMLVNYAVLDPNGFIAKILHLGTLIPNLADYQAALTPILQGTTNIMALLIVFLCAYKLAEAKNGDTLLSAICAVGVFFIIYPPYDENGALSMTFMGAQGLFVAIIVGLLVGEAIPALSKNEKLRIKMPDGVPPAVAQSFNLVIPIIIVFVIASVLSFVFDNVTDGGVQYIIYNMIQVPFRSLGSNIFTVLLFALAQQFLWILGIHGPNTLSAIRSVMFAEQGVANLAYYGEMGTTIGCPFPLTWASINDAFGNTGGSGATLGLTIAKLAFAPGLFNINEPLMFGLPIVMNPIYAIPFIATPLVCNIIGYLCTIVFQIIPPVTLDVGWTTPGFLIPFLGSGGHNPLSLLIGVLCVCVSTLIYMPFVRAAAKANIAREAEAEAEN